MRWEKKGVIYCPNGEHAWGLNTFMTPHALLLNEDVIRIYGGVRDKDGVSRITFIDVSAENPSDVLFISQKPCLDIGSPGCFDDNGVILGDILKIGNEYYMYYVGFQHVQKAKFFAFSGLAVSSGPVHNHGDEQVFHRYSEVPIMDRTDYGKFGRCIHTVLHENGIFKIYYAAIHDWKYIHGIPYPSYNIWYTESRDGIHVPLTDDCLCIDTQDTEYRVGRPKVYREPNGYSMLYTKDLVTKEYLAGYAFSSNGTVWTRDEGQLGLQASTQGWDSEMACYPVFLEAKGEKYMFYNGNGMGLTGVGYAKLLKE